MKMTTMNKLMIVSHAKQKGSWRGDKTMKSPKMSYGVDLVE